ncbi:hypothetical protein [Mycolicibacterium sarraceniae]|uniref:Uncharacterized protein n=1 Tax=Mycolicibacterium sarraceniae TaxID=1534348 RepID=A0A7I7SL01_9MYCO|nr:hypothetical protein [Mycolicibacterium sarraceniae]BBY57677.1 hypothetical protein MSAR_08130 [Mycolicibacterium sarraceniae]
MTSPNHDLAQRMAELARAAAPPRDVNLVLASVTVAAREMLPGTVLGIAERPPVVQADRPIVNSVCARLL